MHKLKKNVRTLYSYKCTTYIINEYKFIEVFETSKAAILVTYLTGSVHKNYVTLNNKKPKTFTKI